jgi:hypothetical protein
MFERFIRLARANKALRERRYEDALQLAAEPSIAGDRRAEDVRAACRQALVERANQRLSEGDATAAAALLARLRPLGEHPAIVGLAAALTQHQAKAAAQADAAGRALAGIRDLLDRGATAAARQRLAAASELGNAERASLARELDERTARAEASLAAANTALARGDLAAADLHERRAAALDADLPAAARLREQLGPRLLERAKAEVALALTQGGVRQALPVWRGLARPEDRVAAAPLLQAPLLEALQGADLATAQTLAQAAAEFPAEPPAADLLAALVLAGDDADAERWHAVATAAAACQARTVQAAAQGRQHTGDATAALLRAAAGLVAAGELEQAVARLREHLVQFPLHERVRRELQVVEQALAAQHERLAAARLAAREGRLAAAASLAAALAGTSPLGVASAQLLAEVRARIAVVDRGVDEVRVGLHGRAAASLEGVRHCLRRLEALGEVQRDHPDLAALQRMVASEVQALDAWQVARDAAVAGDCEPAFAMLAAWGGRRGEFLCVDRLDARFGELGDQLCAAADAALARGSLGLAERVAGALAGAAWADAGLLRRIAQLPLAVAAARTRAHEHLRAARAALAERELGEAERLAGLAAAAADDLSELRSLRDELRTLARHAEGLQRAEALAAEQDYAAAGQKLQGLPPTPALLRTRIYDIKQSLAKAQGLEVAFLLRVDEGGECLVLRGDSVVIGNVRQAQLDLPVLANLAGRHALLRRSLSFHGGMQDTVVALDGPVAVAGTPVRERVLQSGDSVQLGPAFGFRYELPSARSLSARLQLQAGFQVAGTDRVLLLKDRGKDGRLLLGPGRDCHVRVPRASHEVEVFATPNGQIRVACADGGRIDGVAFRGEHPVDAGQFVEAGGIGFVLLPWRPGA